MDNTYPGGIAIARNPWILAITVKKSLKAMNVDL